MRQYLLYQHSDRSMKWIKKQYGLHKRLKTREEFVIPLSYQKALLFSNKNTKEMRKLVDKFNDKYNQRLRIS